jgi:16S rRNA (guanine966-N2)-methyltransferase
MSDKARGGLFNALGDLSDLSVLDAFAGSGALSFEAISRGASSAVAVDIDKSAYQAMQESISALGLEDKIKAIRANVSGWSDNNSDALFDIVIAAPPYDDLQ